MISSLLKTIKKSWVAVKYVIKREKSGRNYAICKLIVTVLGSVLPLIVVVLPGLIINTLSSDNIDFSKLIVYVTALTTYPLIWYVIKHFFTVKLTQLASEFNIHSNEIILSYLAKIDFEDLETPDIQQLRTRADKAMGKVLKVIDIYCGLVGSIIGFISISTIISSLNFFIIVFAIILDILNSIAAKWLQKKGRESKLITDKLNRKKMAYCYAFDDLWFAKEMRLFQSQNFLINRLSENEENINNNQINYMKNEGKSKLVPAVNSMIQQILVYVYLIYLVIKNGLSIGSMTIFISAVASLCNSISNLSSSYLSLANMQYDLDDIKSFFSINLRQFETGDENVTNRIDSIEFKNVCFKYPGSDRFALNNLNLVIKGNEHLCIVGENGAGKSTFINLLMRLYFPTSGNIYINGVNIYDYNYLEYIKLFAPVFQDYCKYDFELKNNICLNNNIDTQRLSYALELSSLLPLINKLKKKEDTFIGKWVDSNGFEPSGGEAQRIAIARALYHGGEIYILDEPTAALDPNAEYEIYTQFHNMIKGKTAILVTHRLSAVQLADKVAVFDDGQIIEYGTHSELYSKGGKYKEMFDKQAQFYVNANHDDKEDDPINQTSNN